MVRMCAVFIPCGEGPLALGPGAAVGAFGAAAGHSLCRKLLSALRLLLGHAPPTSAPPTACHMLLRFIALVWTGMLSTTLLRIQRAGAWLCQQYKDDDNLVDPLTGMFKRHTSANPALTFCLAYTTLAGRDRQTHTPHTDRHTHTHRKAATHSDRKAHSHRRTQAQIRTKPIGEGELHVMQLVDGTC